MADNHNNRIVITADDAHQQFAEAIRAYGLRLDTLPIMDGRIHRISAQDERPGKRSGGYIGHLDNWPAGAFWDHRKPDGRVPWRPNGEIRRLSPEEAARARAEASERAAQREQTRLAAQAVAAFEARRIWEIAKAADPAHPYLARKQIQPHGVRQIGRDLVVPMFDQTGIVNVQTIKPDGTKLYREGAKKQGCWGLVGEIRQGRGVGIAEGFATSAAVHEMTGAPVYVAFDSGNMPHVARAVREMHPDARIAVFPDNDHYLPRRDPPLANAGMVKAGEAAAAVRAVIVAPQFRETDTGTDWLDYRQQHGEQAARSAIFGRFRGNERGAENFRHWRDRLSPLPIEPIGMAISPRRNVDPGLER